MRGKRIPYRNDWSHAAANAMDFLAHTKELDALGPKEMPKFIQ
jgi:hypothetical protein